MKTFSRWYAEHKEEAKKRNAKYREANREKTQQWQKQRKGLWWQIHTVEPSCSHKANITLHTSKLVMIDSLA
jgi:hypothetical protein